MEKDLREFLKEICDEEIIPIGLELKVSDSKEEKELVYEIEEYFEEERSLGRIKMATAMNEVISKKIKKESNKEFFYGLKYSMENSRENSPKFFKGSLKKKVKYYNENFFQIEDVLPLVRKRNRINSLRAHKLGNAIIYEILPLEGEIYDQEKKYYDYKIDLVNYSVIIKEKEYDKIYEEKYGRIIRKKGNFYFIEKDKKIYLFRNKREVFSGYYMKTPKDELLKTEYIRRIFIFSSKEKNILVKFDIQFTNVEKVEDFIILPNKQKVKANIIDQYYVNEYYSYKKDNEIVLYNKYGYNMSREIALKSISTQKIEILNSNSHDNLPILKITYKVLRNIFKDSNNIGEVKKDKEILLNSYILLFDKYVFELSSRDALIDENESTHKERDVGKENIERYQIREIEKIYINDIRNVEEDCDEYEKMTFLNSGKSEKFISKRVIIIWTILSEKRYSQDIIYAKEKNKVEFKNKNFLDFFRSYYDLNDICNGIIQLKNKLNKRKVVFLSKISQKYNCPPANEYSKNICGVKDKDYLEFLISFFEKKQFAEYTDEMWNFIEYLWKWEEKLENTIRIIEKYAIKEWMKELKKDIENLKNDSYEEKEILKKITENIKFITSNVSKAFEIVEFKELINILMSYNFNENEIENYISSIQIKLDIFDEKILDEADNKLRENIIDKNKSRDYLQVLNKVNNEIKLFLDDHDGKELYNLFLKMREIF